MNDLLPISATSQERAISLAVERAATVPTPIRDLWRADECPVVLLPWLAWALSVDTWDPNWTETIKRSVVRTSISTHRQKGTSGAVRGALASLGADLQLVEWFEKSPTGTPHTFTIYIVNPNATIAMQDAMAKAVDRNKPLRSHYDIIFGTTGSGEVNIVGVLRPAIFARLNALATY
jgi:phage tail P2-like protein